MPQICYVYCQKQQLFLFLCSDMIMYWESSHFYHYGNRSFINQRWVTSTQFNSVISYWTLTVSRITFMNDTWSLLSRNLQFHTGETANKYPTLRWLLQYRNKQRYKWVSKVSRTVKMRIFYLCFTLALYSFEL